MSCMCSLEVPVQIVGVDCHFSLYCFLLFFIRKGADLIVICFLRLESFDSDRDVLFVSLAWVHPEAYLSCCDNCLCKYIL